MVESTSISITPATHADRHIVGGADPLVNPLLLHASRHEPGGADEMANVNIPFTEVYNAAAPTGTYTDLDLSTVVGARVSLVALQVYNAVATETRYRTNGDTTDYEFSSTINGTTQYAFPPHGKYGVVVLATDAAGIIEWIANAGNTVVLKVLWFI